MELTKIKQQLTNPEIVGLTIFGEARNQSLDGKVGVGSVIRNRLFSKQNFGGQTYKDICLAEKQFSCWHELGDNYEELKRAVILVIDGKIFGNTILRECIFLGQGIVDNALRDNVNGALYYRTVKLFKDKPFTVKWSIEIGDHIFYQV